MKFAENVSVNSLNVGILAHPLFFTEVINEKPDAKGVTTLSTVDASSDSGTEFGDYCNTCTGRR